MYIILAQESRFDSEFGSIGAKEESIRNDNSGASARFEAAHDEHHEKICRFGGAHICGEIHFCRCLGATSVRWIHGNHIDLVLLFDRRNGRAE